MAKRRLDVEWRKALTAIRREMGPETVASAGNRTARPASQFFRGEKTPDPFSAAPGGMMFAPIRGVEVLHLNN